MLLFELFETPPFCKQGVVGLNICDTEFSSWVCDLHSPGARRVRMRLLQFQIELARDFAAEGRRLRERKGGSRGPRRETDQKGVRKKLAEESRRSISDRIPASIIKEPKQGRVAASHGCMA